MGAAGRARGPWFDPGRLPAGARKIALRITYVPGLQETRPVEEEGQYVPPPNETVHLRFESASGAVLAEAIQRETAGVCEPMRFAFGGEWMTPLEGGGAVVEALRAEIRRAVQTRPPNPPPRFGG